VQADAGVEAPPSGLKRIVAGSEEAKAYSLSRNNGKVPIADGTTPPACVAPADRATDFWVIAQGSFSGKEADPDAEFGAGAVAVMFGGQPVDAVDRRPGDLQQRLDTQDGKFRVDQAGHSSQIYAVQGPGVCRFLPGDATSPKPLSGAPTADGWYEGTWELGPDTAPAHVKRLAVTKVQLIDGNYETDGRDQAIGVGVVKDATTFSPEGASSVESTGRLPTSPWISWVAELDATAPPM
jgi:hypothetical protein